MIVVLLESAQNTILSKVDFFTDKYPKSSIKYITNRTKKDDLKVLEHKPLLSNGWLIIFKDGVFKSSFLNILKPLIDNNLIIIRVTNETSSDELLSLLESEKIKFKFINNYKLKREDLISYVCSKINISKNDAMYLCNCCNWYLPKLMENTQTLSILDKCSRKDIKRYVDQNRNIAVFDLVNYMLGLNKNIHYEDCLALVWDYRFGFEHLIKSVRNQLNLFLQVFILIIEGKINSTNYKSVEINNKEISALNKYRLYKIIDAFDYVTLDYVYLLITKLEQVPFNYGGMFDFISILKWNSKGVMYKTNIVFKEQNQKEFKTIENNLKHFNESRYHRNDGISANVLDEISNKAKE